MQNLRPKIILFFIILLALVLRIYKIDLIPGRLNRDEAAIGYNAYTILKTGRDEYGKRLPLFFKSFGDWKMPLYIYFTVPSTAVFGLNEFAVRFPSALFGTLTVLMIYFLTRELFRPPRRTPGFKRFNPGVEELAALLLTISPWHIDASRQAYEVNLAVFLLALGSWLLLKKNKSFIFLSLICFSLVIFTYHGAILLGLILFVYLMTIKPAKEIRKDAKIKYILAFIVIILISQVFEKEAIKDKFWTTSVFQDQSISLERVYLLLKEHKQQNILTRIFHNKINEGIIVYGENYFRSLSLDFLFFGSDKNSRWFINKKSPQLNYLIFLPFYLGGLYLFFKAEGKKEKFVLLWLLTVPVLTSFLVRSPSSFRNLAEVIPITLIIAYTIVYFFSKIKNVRIKKTLIIIIIFFGCLDGIKIGEEYVFHLEGGFDHYYQKILSNFNTLERLKGKPLAFVSSHPEFSPYIFVAFYEKIEPDWFFANVKRYPPDQFGFEHVCQLGQKYQFRTINWQESIQRDIVYVDLFQELPGEVKDINTDKIIINNKQGEPVFFEFVY